MPGLWQCEPGSCPCLHQAGRRLGIMVPSHTLAKLLMDYTLLLQNFWEKQTGICLQFSPHQESYVFCV